jgi:hypothetical protein
MQKPDPQIAKAKQEVMKLFTDDYGRPKKTPYYVAQLQTLLENQFFPWITHQAAEQLVNQNILSRIETTTKCHSKVVFFYNAKLDDPKLKPSVETHIKSICKLIDSYSEHTVCKALGDHLEGLVKAELRAQGFTIVGAHTRKYKNKDWTKTDHNLDFIAEHYSCKIKIGVEVKNTLPTIEREELDIKLDMCDFFRITPVFAVRWLKPYIELIRNRGGFSWMFKTQIYPPGFEELTKTLYKRLNLPVTVRTELPEKSVDIFQRWINSKIS